jgi:hypothetical protein
MSRNDQASSPPDGTDGLVGRDELGGGISAATVKVNPTPPRLSKQLPTQILTTNQSKTRTRWVVKALFHSGFTL